MLDSTENKLKTKLKTEFDFKKCIASVTVPQVKALHQLNDHQKDLIQKNRFASIKEMKPAEWNNIPIPLSECLQLLTKAVTDLNYH
jgi:hypothetical protein